MKPKQDSTFNVIAMVQRANLTAMRCKGLVIVLFLCIFTVDVQASSHEMTIRVIENDDFSSATELSLPPRATRGEKNRFEAAKLREASDESDRKEIEDSDKESADERDKEEDEDRFEKDQEDRVDEKLEDIEPIEIEDEQIEKPESIEDLKEIEPHPEEVKEIEPVEIEPIEPIEPKL